MNFIKGILTLLANRSFLEVIFKAARLFSREGFYGVYLAVLKISRYELAYSSWVREFDKLTTNDFLLIKQHIDSLCYMPRISVIMPVYNTPEKYLNLAIESVKKQFYQNWELCIADDASTLSHIPEILEQAKKSDPRIKVVYRCENGHISAATNSALEMVTGEFVSFLDHDDELAPHALYMIVVALNKKSNLDLIYSDEDKIGLTGKRFDPYFKPDWNPDLLLGQNYINHLTACRTSIARNLGGLRIGIEGSQDWDFILRVAEHTDSDNIFHIPHILYHWRAASGSTALGVEQKRYAADAAKKALTEYWQRQSREVRIEELGKSGHYRTIFPLPNELPVVSIIVPTQNRLDLLRKCLDGLFNHTDYSAKEIIVVDNRSDDPATLAYLEELVSESRIRLLKYDAPFNFSAINNIAVTQVEGELICLLNNDIEPVSPDWLKEMVTHALRPEIGVVGAMLYYPDDTIQHAGVLLGVNGTAGHLYQHLPRRSAGQKNRALLVQNLSAVTAACMLVRREVWEEVGGMDEINFEVEFNDIDFCLNVQKRGYRNLWTPYAELYHHESASRGYNDTLKKLARHIKETAVLRARWGGILDNDPAWNPNLYLDGAWPSTAHPPRTKKPWLNFKDSLDAKDSSK